MASISVSPTTVAPGATFVVTYAGGNRIRFVGPITKTTVRTPTSGKFGYTLPTAGTYRVDLRNSGATVATTRLTVGAVPVVIDPIPPPPPAPSPTEVGRAGRGRIEDWIAGRRFIVVAENRSYTSTQDDFGVAESVRMDASVLKVIVAPRFSGSGHGWVPDKWDTWLMWDATFEGLRTRDPGRGCHGINFSQWTDHGQVIGSFFGEVSADGWQIGGGSSADTRALEIAYCDGIGPGRVLWGENFGDQKGNRGGLIHVHHNLVDGYFPCKSPKLGGNQDCSGSQGEGMVIHGGSGSGRARTFSYHDNRISNCFGGGLIASECEDGDIGPNIYVNCGRSLTVHAGTAKGAIVPGVDRLRVSRAQTLIGTPGPDVRVPVQWY